MIFLQALPVEVAQEVGQIGLWIQAVGLIVIFWVIFQLVTLYFNRKRRLTLYAIREDLKRLERKIDGLGKKK